MVNGRILLVSGEQSLEDLFNFFFLPPKLRTAKPQFGNNCSWQFPFRTSTLEQDWWFWSGTKSFYSWKLASILLPLSSAALFKSLLFFLYIFLSVAATLTVMYGRERGRTMNKQRHKLLDSRRGRNPRVCVCVFFFFSNRVSAFLQPVSCHSTYLPGERNCTWNIFQKPNHGTARGRPGTIKKRERDSWVKENERDWGRGEQEGHISET